MGEFVKSSASEPETEVRVLPWVRPPVFSGDQPEGSQDLRPVQIIPIDALPEGAKIVNDPAEGVIIEVRAARIQPEPIEFGL